MKVKDRIKALDSAYMQLMNALEAEVDQDEVEPEKRKIAMSMYRLAQEDSRKIFDELVELKGLRLVSAEEADAIEINRVAKKTGGGGLSPEDRIKKR